MNVDNTVMKYWRLRGSLENHRVILYAVVTGIRPYFSLYRNTKTHGISTSGNFHNNRKETYEAETILNASDIRCDRS